MALRVFRLKDEKVPGVFPIEKGVWRALLDRALVFHHDAESLGDFRESSRQAHKAKCQKLVDS
jgi:hypothetical protein